MAVELFAGISVSDFATAQAWYERLLGAQPSMLPHPTEAVWELGEGRWIYINEDPDKAGFATHTIFCEELDEQVAAIERRGLQADASETYGNGVRKITYRDADGNEIGFGGAPASADD